MHRSNRYTVAQLIDDAAGKTLVFESTKALPKSDKLTKVAQATLLGERLAEQAKKLGIKNAVFNKGPYLYHGRVKAVAEGARLKGLVL